MLVPRLQVPGLLPALLATAIFPSGTLGQTSPSHTNGSAAGVSAENRYTGAKQYTGDMDVLLKHRGVRIGVPYSKTLFYTVKGVQYGMVYENGKEFERYLNKKYPQQNKNIKLHVLFVVTSAARAAQDLINGNVDILMGGIVIRAENQKIADFSDPVVTGVKEIVVKAPNSPPIASVDDLSGKEVFVRKTSSYWEHVEQLNEQFKKDNKQTIKLVAVPEDLGDEDILEMVNAGLLPSTVVSDWRAKLWSQFLRKMQIHADVVIGAGDSYGWAIRKNSPRLMADLNEYIKTHREDTAFGQQLVGKYIGSNYMLKAAVSPDSMKRFEQTAQEFRKYSDKYGMDYLLMMAEGYQESGLNQQAKSSVGAIGIMQLMPDTGKDMKVGDITQEEANVHAGVKYFSTTMKKLYGNEPMDDINKVLFTFAAYNCGPARVKQLRAEAAQKGLDPNVWMNNVEFVAAARVGQETVDYVTNIYKYYVAYKLIAVQEEQRNKARESFVKNQ